MTLAEFIKVTHEEVDRFQAYYLKEKKAAEKKGEGDRWPLQAGEGDWYEQFIAWQQMHNKE